MKVDELKAKYPDADLEKILKFISERKGIDLTSYRRNFVDRHLRMRLREVNAENYLEYITYVKNDPLEMERFLDDLSINVTHFFRDKDVFESFRSKVLPELMGSRREGTPQRKLVRVWSAACATGKEPYSLAMMFSEATAGNPDLLIRIWATDVDADALEKAKQGSYDESDLKELPDRALAAKYFERGENRCTVKDALKALVRFEKHNLISDQPLKFMDAIFCRNVMIYFRREQQEILLKKFHQALNPNGFLVVAKVESVWDKSLFAPVDPIRKIYRKVEAH